jgi:hypothetical protein
MKLWALLVNMPAEVVASQVLSRLSAIDIVRLDSANFCHDFRQIMEGTLLLCPPWPMNLCPKTTGLECVVWNWFWKRSLPIVPSSPKTSLDLFSTMIGNEHLVHGDIHLICSEKDCSLRCIRALGLLGLARKVTKLSLAVKARKDPILKCVPALVRLTALIINALWTLPEEALLEILQNVAPLSSLEFEQSHFMSDELMEAIMRHARTLTALSLRGHKGSARGWCKFIAQCGNLRDLRLPGEFGDPAVIPADCLVAVAEGCPKLQRVRFSKTDPSIDVLAVFASHCPDLQSIVADLSTCLPLTDAGLAAVVHNCPHLTELQNVIWAVRSESSVKAAGSWLQQLQRISLRVVSSSTRDGDDGNFCATPTSAVSCMVNARTLSLSGVTLNAQLLHSLSTGYFQLDALDLADCSLPAGAPMGAAMVAIASHNPQLTALCLPSNAWLRDDVVVDIAARCPLLQELHIRGDTPSVLTDAALVALAQGCPKLTMVQSLSGPQLTDAAVLALAECCPGLKSVRLEHSPHVTGVALMIMVQRCCKLSHLCVCRSTIDEDVAARLRAASRAESGLWVV